MNGLDPIQRKSSSISQKNVAIDNSHLPISGKNRDGPHYSRQLLTMLRRNYILHKRHYQVTIAECILAPFVFTLLLFLLQQADYAQQKSKVQLNPKSTILEGVYNCETPRGNCINILYTSSLPALSTGQDTARAFMSAFAKANSLRTGEPPFIMQGSLSDVRQSPPTNYGIYQVPSSVFIYDYVSNNPNTTAWGISFSLSQKTDGVNNYQYQLWYNSTTLATSEASSVDVYGTQLISFVRGMDEAMITILNDPTATVTSNLNITFREWPVIPEAQLTDTIVQTLGPVFVFCSEMVIFINILNQVTVEKENMLRHGMQIMGLQPSVYWLSTFISFAVMMTINSLLLCSFANMFQFSAFTRSNFGILFLIFVAFGFSLILFAFFITTLVRKSRLAILVGIFLFIAGLIMESFVFSSSYIGYIWWSPNLTPALYYFLALVPFFNFGKAFLDVVTFTIGRRDALTSTYIPGPGFYTSSWVSSIPATLLPTYGLNVVPDVPPPIVSFYLLLMNMLVYGLLTWYLDNVLADSYGNRQPLLFFLDKKYWGFDKEGDGKTMNVKAWIEQVDKPADGKGGRRLMKLTESERTVLELEKELACDPTHNAALRVIRLRKEYRAPRFTWPWRKKVPKTNVAVNSLCLALPKGRLLALLGQNGAGKSTAIHMLSGATKCTYGDALINGLSVANQMSAMRRIMGICPQHDILFNDLTAKEHIELFAGIKGIPKESLEFLIKERLSAVRLLHVANHPTSSFSGGMKRRLSLAISTIGDPEIIFMDEPTTGMDPVNRRFVWQFIQKLKRDRIIVLTTHSMEEADVLADRIAIMAHGELRAIGNAVFLKNQYGAGYRISIVTDSACMDLVKEMVQREIPEAKLESDSAGSLIFQFASGTASSKIPGLIRQLEANESGLIRAWGISQTTLEEVFLNVIREANPEGYTAAG